MTPPAPPPPPPSRRTPRRVRPPRKSTAQARREQKAVLLRELESLAAQLRRRRRDRRETSTESAAAAGPAPRGHDTATAAQQLQARLLHASAGHDHWIAGLRGLLRSYEATLSHSPLHVPLVLPTGPAQRRALLRRLHAAKIRDAHAFVTQQCGTLDLAAPYRSLDMVGDVIAGLEIMPFPGITDVRRVFDAMQFWMSNVEICITEQLGSVTVREDDEEDGTTDDGDAYSSLRRVRSMLDCGVVLQGNFAIFRQFFPAVTPADDPYAVMTVQPVDGDPLFPFHAEEHVQVQLHGGMVLSKSRGFVVLARWAKLQLQIPQGAGAHAPTPEQAEAVRRDAARWLEVLHQVLRERVYAGERC